MTAMPRPARFQNALERYISSQARVISVIGMALQQPLEMGDQPDDRLVGELAEGQLAEAVLAASEVTRTSARSSVSTRPPVNW